jgi:F420-dependent oxidoreductase-like protein
MLDVWTAADDIEVFESAWNWDHFYPLAPPYEGPNLEGWTTLGALAQATNRIRIGCMVNGMHHRHAAVTANMIATLDHISNGRFEFGIGAGWNEMETDAYGLNLGSLNTRSDRLEEGVEVIVELLTNQTTSHQGTHYQLTDAWCEPKCVQQPYAPIVIGGKGRKRTLRTAARFANQWDMTFPAQPADWEELNEVLLGHCADVGRDPTEITRSIHLSFEPDNDPAADVALAQTFFDVGVDVVVWSYRGELDPARLEPLATAVQAAA